MNLWSVSFSYRLGLGFHALNNEGSDGSNVMQPRRIDVGKITYDGISGEICRRHIMENLVKRCSNEDLLPLSMGLHPDRGPLGIRAVAKMLGHKELSANVIYPSVRKAIQSCAVLDIGGYLAAWKESGDTNKEKDYIAEKEYIESNCALLPQKDNPSPMKRDSRFDVGWLISENPQDLVMTQHSTYRDTASKNNIWVQSMRSNIYGGVIRANLHQIGMDDHWYLQPKDTNGDFLERLAISSDLQKKRQKALINAIADFILAPSGAKTAGWAPHVFLLEGVILLSSDRTAPFISPISVDLNQEQPVTRNAGYIDATLSLKNERDIWAFEFRDMPGLLTALDKVKRTMGLGDGEKGV